MPKTTEQCPHCHCYRAYGCSFTCPEKQPPSNPQDYQHWADEQKKQYARQDMTRRKT